MAGMSTRRASELDFVTAATSDVSPQSFFTCVFFGM